MTLYSRQPAAFESRLHHHTSSSSYMNHRESSASTLRRSYSHHSSSSSSSSSSSASSSSSSASCSPISRSPPVQIYDLDFLELETSSSSSSLTSASDYDHQQQQQHVIFGSGHRHPSHGGGLSSEDDEVSSSSSSSASSASSVASTTAAAAELQRRSVGASSTPSSKSSSIKTSNHSQNSENRMTSTAAAPASSSSRSSTNSSFHSSSVSTASAAESDEAFTFQDFISSIINDNQVEWHKLIVQDLARLLELKFREFKKSVAQLNSNKSAQPIRNFITNTSISLDVDTDLFTKIAQKVLEMASEEPNGILGARIRLRIMCEDGQCHDMCQCFAYDSNTMATSEITVTIKEDIRSLKRLLQTFKLYSNFSKYVSLHVDSNNFDIIKKRLY